MKVIRLNVMAVLPPKSKCGGDNALDTVSSAFDRDSELLESVYIVFVYTFPYLLHLAVFTRMQKPPLALLRLASPFVRYWVECYLRVVDESCQPQCGDSTPAPV